MFKQNPNLDNHVENLMCVKAFPHMMKIFRQCHTRKYPECFSFRCFLLLSVVSNNGIKTQEQTCQNYLST